MVFRPRPSCMYVLVLLPCIHVCAVIDEQPRDFEVPLRIHICVEKQTRQSTSHQHQRSCRSQVPTRSLNTGQVRETCFASDSESSCRPEKQCCGISLLAFFSVGCLPCAARASRFSSFLFLKIYAFFPRHVPPFLQ
ncbi:hypothetical protein DFH94DRAFT_781322 [Russula ochroleuca]|uniref:Secreted protein n=1 Tax=Russula ochroleuca TaxID=152965 RepID=A0A9P5JVX4_9AGAM|nr:hypothetical protein DFH94DRAFT_790019 [Russula ochroleuca]KAF8466275.1 hypothetical protein DFH94DRAFT_781322 [Russula ochroleuca]